MTQRGITADERALVCHIIVVGSAGYPVRKSGRGWVVDDWRSVKGPPTVFKRKRDAVEHFERFLDILRDALAGRI